MTVTDWVGSRDLERDADFDPDVKKLLEQSGGSLDAVRDRMTDYVENTDDTVYRSKTGRPEPVQVAFREYDPAAVYVRPRTTGTRHSNTCFKHLR